MWVTDAPFTLRVKSWEATRDLWADEKPVPLLVTHATCQILDSFPEAMLHFSASTEAIPGFYGGTGNVPDTMNIWMRITPGFPNSDSPALAETWVEDARQGISEHTTWDLQDVIDASGEGLFADIIVGDLLNGGGKSEKALFDAFTRFQGGDVEFDAWLA